MAFCRSLVLCLFLAGACCGTALPGYTGNANIDSAYKFHRTRVTWEEASRTCANEGAELFVINSQEEADLLKGLLISQRIGHICWSGLRRNENEFRSVGGQTMSSSGYSRWKAAPSSQNSNDNCAIMWSCGRYGERSCNELHPFICEQTNYQNAVLENETDIEDDLFAV